MKHKPHAPSATETDVPIETPAPADRSDGAPDATAPPAEASTAAEPESAADYRDRWMRAAAELQNFRRRSQRDADEARRSAEERVMLELIQALDDLERALDAAKEADAPESWTRGVALVARRLGEFLARQGVTALDPVGQPFDPAFHEAMMEVESDVTTPGHVVQVAQRGYRRGDRALRAARVAVAKRPTGSDA